MPLAPHPLQCLPRGSCAIRRGQVASASRWVGGMQPTLLGVAGRSRRSPGSGDVGQLCACARLTQQHLALQEGPGQPQPQEGGPGPRSPRGPAPQPGPKTRRVASSDLLYLMSMSLFLTGKQAVNSLNVPFMRRKQQRLKRGQLHLKRTAHGKAWL